MTYMLDTNICIYVMKKKPEAALRRFRQEMDGGLCISSVTLAELEFGVQNSGPAAASEYGAVRAFLQKKGTPIGPLDMLIAAHARAEGLTLVTNNTGEFARVPELELENWAE